MKSFIASAVAVMAIVYQPSVHAQGQVAVGPGSVVIDKIEPAVIKTPEYSVNGGPQKRSVPGNWLEIEVEFDVKVPEVDELTFTYQALIANNLVTGSVTHINIPGGKKHYSVMYVAPRSLDKLTGGKPLTSAAIQNVWVSVSRQGQVINASAAPKKENPPNLPQMSGYLLNKSETPFAPLFFDRYEAIKPNVR